MRLAVGLVAPVVCLVAAGCGHAKAEQATLTGVQECLQGEPGVGAHRALLEGLEEVEGFADALSVVFPLDGQSPSGSATVFVAGSAEDTARIGALLDRTYTRSGGGFLQDQFHRSGNVAWYWNPAPTAADEKIVAGCVDG